MEDFKSLWRPESWLEDVESAKMNFEIGENDAESFVEKAYWDSPEPAQVAAGANLIEPEKAEPLAKSVTAAKAAGTQAGIGIVPAIFAGLAGAFSDNGVATTNKLLQQWDPKTQEAKRVKRKGVAQKVEQEGREMDRTAAMRDPTSPASQERVAFYAEKFKGFPKLASMFEGLSAEEADQRASSLTPELKHAIGFDERDLRREELKEDKEYRRTIEERDWKAQQDALKLEKERYKTGGEKKVDTEYAKDYNEWTTTGRADYVANKKRMQDTVAELQEIDAKLKSGEASWGEELVSGRFAGEMPDVARTADSLRLEEQVRGTIFGILRATMGAQFTEKEGERVMKDIYNPKLEPEVNIPKITSWLGKQQAAADAQDSKGEYYESKGTLKGYEADLTSEPAADEDTQALEWARANPDDPRAQRILQSLGAQ